MTAVVDAMGVPVAGVITRSESSIRDGLVLDYMGAIRLLREQVNCLRAAGFNIKKAAGAYPPGTVGRNAQAVANVLYAADLEVPGLIDEPSAAAKVLRITDGAVVDIGGGTTGNLRDPRWRADLHGRRSYRRHARRPGVGRSLQVDVEEAEKIKTDPARQREIFPLVTPVFQKMASIVKQHLNGYSVDTLYLVGRNQLFSGN